MTKQVTLLFPGQGSQYVGMGKKLEGLPAFTYFQQADAALEFPLTKLCLEGPVENLKLTQNTQPAIFTYSFALFTELSGFLKQENIQIQQVLGHSVGEYAALAAADVFSFAEAVKTVHLRGKFMQEAVPVGKGKMIALLKLEESLVRKACEAASQKDSQVQPANFNDPGQIVISGHAEACDRAVKWLQENNEGRFRAVELPVSAPFHSSLMQPAAEQMQKVLEGMTVRPSKLPYIANIDAKLYPAESSAEVIKENLRRQICGSVLWTQSIVQLPADSLLIEVGPGKILKNLVKKIRPELKTISLDDKETLDAAYQAINQELA